jgi:hypothetical protein
MFNSYEYMVDGDFCTINKCETDDELVESVKCMKEISFCRFFSHDAGIFLLVN